jgi:hypothetical protein
MAWEAIGGQKATQRLPQGGRGGFGPPRALQGTRSLALTALKWILRGRATRLRPLSLQAMPLRRLCLPYVDRSLDCLGERARSIITRKKYFL